MITVNSLWIGEELSNMEMISINSHIKAGHKYNLWCYSKIKNAPENVNLCDAKKILPESDVFCYQTGLGKGSFSAFSNIFRYKFLFEHGGWWVDTDLVAIRPFEFTDDYVFASERLKNGDIHPTTCVIKLPPKSDFALKCYNKSISYDRSTLEWSTIGPKLITTYLKQSDYLNKFVKNPDIFCPIDWHEINTDLTLQRSIDLSESFGVHLWNEIWRRLGINKNKEFDKNTFYEKLKSNYLCTYPQNSGNEHNVVSRYGKAASLFCEKAHSYEARLGRML